MNPINFSKILIVDDSPFFRAVIKKILKEANIGKIYHEAKDGKEAISKYVASRPPHLVIMDIKMPNIDGLKANKAIMKFDPNAKIIVISAKENKETVDDAIKAGAKDYLLKPFDAGQVVMAVSKQLASHKV